MLIILETFLMVYFVAAFLTSLFVILLNYEILKKMSSFGLIMFFALSPILVTRELTRNKE